MSERKRYIKTCEVSELVEITAGGYPQKILIEGFKKDLPVIIFLHGGLGSPVPFSCGCRGLFPEWSERAITVYWEQLGCGINNYKIDDGFTIDGFAEMTCDVIGYVKNRFPENKIYLLGVSWGSILALKAANKIPEKIAGVFTYGQFLLNNFFSEEVKGAFASAPEKVKKDVERIAKTGYDCEYKVLDKNLRTLYKYLSKYTDAYFNKSSKPISVGKIVLGLILSPDYSLKDFKAIVNNGYRGNQSLWGELVRIDLREELEKITVPYYLFQGDTDVVTSTKTVLSAVESLNNPEIRCEVMKNSGHMPSEDAMIKIFERVYEIVV